MQTVTLSAGGSGRRSIFCGLRLGFQFLQGVPRDPDRAVSDDDVRIFAHEPIRPYTEYLKLGLLLLGVIGWIWSGYVADAMAAPLLGRLLRLPPTTTWTLRSKPAGRFGVVRCADDVLHSWDDHRVRPYPTPLLFRLQCTRFPHPFKVLFADGVGRTAT